MYRSIRAGDIHLRYMKVDKIKQVTYLQKKNVSLFKQEVITSDKISYNGKNVIKNAHFGFWNNLILSSINKMNPVLVNHPRIATIVLKAGEKIIRKHDIFDNVL